MNQKMRTLIGAAVVGTLGLAAQSAFATCQDIPRATLVAAVGTATTANNDAGYPLSFWITTVDETGMVCDVVTNGTAGAMASRSEWLGSRVISAQKANTANAFSLDAYTIATGNLYSAVNPGGSLYGLQHSNPVDASRAYQGSPVNYGQANDPLKGKRVGGVNVFGGGLALYKNGHKVGAIGVSGDTSCADHSFAWNVRNALGMNPTAAGAQTAGLAGPGTGITTVNFTAGGAAATPLAGATEGDELIINGASPDAYWQGWGQPACPNSTATAGIINN